MTLRYAHVSDRDVQAAAERIGKTIEAAMETGKSTTAISSCGAAINLRRRDRPERTSQPTGENRDWGSEVMSKEHVDWPQGDAGSAEKRKPRSIRFHDTEWERIKAFAEQRGMAAAEFVRFAALEVIEDRSEWCNSMDDFEASILHPRMPIAPTAAQSGRRISSNACSCRSVGGSISFPTPSERSIWLNKSNG